MSQEHSNKFVMLKRVKQLQDDPNVLDQFSRFCDLQTLFPSDCISDVSKFIERVETVKEEGTYAFTEDCFSFAAGLSEERTTENGQSGKVLRILDTVIFIREWVREKFHNADYSKNGMNIDAVLNEEIREQIRNDFVELLEECTAIISNKSHVTFRDAYSLLCHYEKHKGVMSSLLSYCNQVKYTVNQKESNKLHVRSSEYENKNRRIVMDIAQGESSHVKSFYNLGDAEAPYECKRCLNELKAIYHLICLNQRMVQTVFETCRKSSMEVTVHHDTEGLFEWFFDLQIRIINEECVAQKLQAFREEHQKIGCTLYQDFSAHVAQITYLERNEDYEEMFSCDEFWNEMIVKTNKEFHSSMQWFFEKRPKGDKRIETYMDYFERRDENWMLKAHMNSERLTLVAYSAVYNPVLDKYLMLERSCYCICRQCNVTKRYMANTGKKTDFCCMEEEEALEEVKKLFTEQSHKDEVEKVYKALVQKVKDSIDDSIDRQEKIKNAVPEFVRHRMSQEHSNKFVMLKRVKQLQDDPNVLDQFSRFCDLQTLFPSDCISDVSKFIERVETVKEEGTYAFTEDCFSFAAGLSEERTTENGQSGKVLRILDTVIFIREWVREKFHNADYSKNGMNIDAVLNEEIREQIRNDFVELLEECTAIISNKSHVTFRDAYSLLCHYEKHKGVMSSLLSYCNQVKYTVNQKESNKLHVRSSEYENKNRRIVMDIAQGESSHVKSFYNLGDAEAPYECKRCLNELKAIYHLICLNQRMVQTVFETCRKSSMEVTVHHDTEGLFEWFFDLQIRIINEECVAQKLQAFREEHQKVRIALEKLAVGMKKDKGEKDNNKPPPAVNVGPFVVAFHFKDPARNLDESNIKDLTKTKRLEATKFIRTVKNISTVTIFGQQFRNDLDLYATLCPDIRANYGELYTKAGNLTKQPVSRFQSRAAEQLQKKILLFGCETQLMEKTMKKANFKKQLKLFLLINSKQARDILEKAHQKLEDQLTDLIGCTLYQDFSAHVAQITYLERNEDYEEMFSCDEFWNEMIVKTNKEFHSSMQWFFEKRPKGDKRIETYMDYFERRDENWMLKAHMNSERLTLVAYSAVYNPVLDKYLMLERSCYCICRQCNVTKRYMANTGKKTDFCCMENLERPWKEKRRTLPRPFKRAEEEGQENAKIEARLDSTLKPLDDADKDELDYEEEPHSRTPDTSTESRTTSLDAEEPCF
ncbi:hypothetical protein QR680_014568 [Steinernema hermaphroditum]|uniref:Uncharacterized protein n=1 Tax=Steinernema hermaphroditum TaxID=289476 RepID=A0AA39I9C3_9BILA|nr:hypothetical protein QR680_014568 [Steinernema hermaphroditum]